MYWLMLILSDSHLQLFLIGIAFLQTKATNLNLNLKKKISFMHKDNLEYDHYSLWETINIREMLFSFITLYQKVFSQIERFQHK